MPVIPQILPSVRACFALAGLALGCAACAPTMPYDQIAYAAPDCRPFQQLVTVNGKQQTRYTTQCRQADGTWRVVAQSDGSSSTASAQPQAGAGAVVPITPNPSGDAYGTEPDDPSFAIGAAMIPTTSIPMTPTSIPMADPMRGILAPISRWDWAMAGLVGVAIILVASILVASTPVVSTLVVVPPRWWLPPWWRVPRRWWLPRWWWVPRWRGWPRWRRWPWWRSVIPPEAILLQP